MNADNSGRTHLIHHTTALKATRLAVLLVTAGLIAACGTRQPTTKAAEPPPPDATAQNSLIMPPVVYGTTAQGLKLSKADDNCDVPTLLHQAVQDQIEEPLLHLLTTPTPGAAAAPVLTVEVSEGLPPLLADRVQIQQVLLNLMLNAVDAMRRVEPGQARLAVTVDVNAGGEVKFSVRDNGMGVAPENIDRIFDAFYTTKEEGMGIGLAISRSIIEAHGGRIWVMPEPSVGATFHFTLPTGKMDT